MRGPHAGTPHHQFVAARWGGRAQPKCSAVAGNGSDPKIRDGDDGSNPASDDPGQLATNLTGRLTVCVSGTQRATNC
jgi:hypothetical protein